MTRLVSHRDAFKAVVAAHEPELIAFEGYARGAATYREEMGELQGLLRVHTHDCGIPYIVVPPMSLKKFTTGSGGVDKNQMRLAVYKRWGFDSTGYPDDVADAYALAQFALLYLSGSAPVSYQAEVIAKVKANPYGLAKGAA
jgi:Holliday junction resolvasome RuvABC endonuclease subunit